MPIKDPYIAKLKEESGLSWSDLEEKTGFPLSTIRDHLTGRVVKPSQELRYAVVEAMGGDVTRLGGVPAEIRKDIARVQQLESSATEEQRLTIDAMRRLRGEMLDLQRESFEREIRRLEASNRLLRTMLVIAVSILVVSLLCVICVLIYDLTHLDRGWIQAYFSSHSRAVIDILLSYWR